MLTLGKFLIKLGVVAVVIFAGLFALANYVDVNPRDMSFNVTADKMNRDSTR